MSDLIAFVEGQFSRRDEQRRVLWCWETIFEEVAARAKIVITADNLTYAGGTLRTGCYGWDSKSF